MNQLSNAAQPKNKEEREAICAEANGSSRNPSLGFADGFSFPDIFIASTFRTEYKEATLMQRGMAFTRGHFCLWDYNAPIFIFITMSSFNWKAVAQKMHYSIPEEMPKGSFVGNVAKDLELDIKDFSYHRVTFVCRGKTEYFALNNRNGHLYIKETLDREQICPRVEMCFFSC